MIILFSTDKVSCMNTHTLMKILMLFHVLGLIRGVGDVGCAWSSGCWASTPPRVCIQLNSSAAAPSGTCWPPPAPPAAGGGFSNRNRRMPESKIWKGKPALAMACVRSEAVSREPVSDGGAQKAGGGPCRELFQGMPKTSFICPMTRTTELGDEISWRNQKHHTDRIGSDPGVRPNKVGVVVAGSGTGQLNHRCS